MGCGAAGRTGSASAGRGAAPWLRSRRSRGATYLTVLFLVAALGVASAAAGRLWGTAVQRERERELLFAGEQYRRAIGGYYESGTGPVKQYPRSLTELLSDSRRPGVRRHLRRIYRDPVSDSLAWGEVRAPDGGIMGVYSRSRQVPLKRSGFSSAQRAFADAQRYADWRFVYVPEPAGPAGVAPTAGGAPL